MKILVTGDRGFIGSHIVRELNKLEHNVTGHDLPRGFEYDGDEAPPGPYDCIIHAGAIADVKNNWHPTGDLDELFLRNVGMTESLLRNNAETPFVFLSSCAVYGDAARAHEDLAVRATSPYAASKIAGEAFVQCYAERYGNPYHIFRLAACVGSGYHHGHIADFADAAKGGLVTPMSDGWADKAYVHVEDAVSAILLAVRRGLPSGTYNVSSGTWTCRDTARVMGPKAHFNWQYSDKPKGWVGDPLCKVSSAKLRNHGWTPTRSIETGVREALEGLGWKP